MYRQTKNYENLQKRIFDGVGEYGIPQIQPTQYKECEWIGFSWSTPDSFEWCFDGEPMGGAVAVSSVSAANSKAKKELFLAGYNEMLVRLRPEVVLFMGKVPEECQGNIVPIKAFQERFKKVM